MTRLTLTQLAWTPLGHGYCHHQLPLRDVNALMAGEQTAVTLGLNARNVRLRVFLIAPEDLPIDVATAAMGGLFFIGLMRKR